jgi:hypothetical protein
VPRTLKIKVTSIEQDEAAKLDGRALKELERTIKERCAKPKRDLDNVKKFILDTEKLLLSPVQRAIKHVADQCIAWKNEQARVAEEKRLEEQKEAEAKAKAAAEADAQAAEAANEPELAKEIREEPVSVPVPEAKPAVAKVSGVAPTGTYKCEVIDYPNDKRKFLELVVHVAQNPDDVNVLLPNMPALNDMARAKREGFSMPGCRAVKSEGMRFS